LADKDGVGRLNLFRSSGQGFKIGEDVQVDVFSISVKGVEFKDPDVKVNLRVTAPKEKRIKRN